MIQRATVAQALSLLEAQRFVPDSPAAHDPEGNICLCAAGLLAMAGLQAEFAREAPIFAKLAVTKLDRAIVSEAFERLGWPHALCHDMQQQNDFTPPEQRKHVVAERLARLLRA